MATRYYQKLERELDRLSRCYLPRTRRAYGYNAPELEKTRAYLAFSHAAIERYLEEISLHVVRRGLSLYQARRGVKPSIVSLCVRFLPVKGVTDVPIRVGPGTETCENIIRRLVQVYENSIVLKNNGISQRDVFKLLLPIGVEQSELDVAWLASMDALSRKRGSAVHSLGKPFIVRHSPDPFDIKRDVDSLLNFPGGGGLRDLDDLLKKK